MLDQLLIAQIFGFISFILGVSTFYQKDDRKLKILMLIFNLNHVVHFLLLGTLVSALSALVSALRTATSIYVSSKLVASAFIAVGLVIGVFLADSVWDLLPILGMVIGTYSIFVLKGIAMRIAFLMGSVCWLINNILVGSIGGTLLEATVIVINSITVLRMLREERILIENSSH
ncbi:permease [Psychromonas marina]|uniref:Permease n=1 Tax=Psychromonas marina TaxID=88364 RepID=A0ABQ6DYV9_9GAMM|nr:YgjV family protein [Psychromonas marina]GLS90170.1 permease [Psychromonas marina]